MVFLADFNTRDSSHPQSAPRSWPGPDHVNWMALRLVLDGGVAKYHEAYLDSGWQTGVVHIDSMTATCCWERDLTCARTRQADPTWQANYQATRPKTAQPHRLAQAQGQPIRPRPDQARPGQHHS